MEAIILAGGLPSSIGEFDGRIPKPMAEIGEKPILWHIMKHYSSYGFSDFIICCGYKGNEIKDFFVHYNENVREIRCNLPIDSIESVNWENEDWKVTIVDTGVDTLTAGRLQKVKKYIGDEPFMMTYGDGVADINITKLLEYHNNNPKVITISFTKPDGRFGALHLDKVSGDIRGFKEKARAD